MKSLANQATFPWSSRTRGKDLPVELAVGDDTPTTVTVHLPPLSNTDDGNTPPRQITLPPGHTGIVTADLEPANAGKYTLLTGTHPTAR